MNQVESSFLANVVPAAMATARLCGVPASITLAQAILESGWGASSLARQANNFFGIKAASTTDPNSYAEFPTTEFVNGRSVRELAAFARYPSPAASFQAHAALLESAPRYAQAMAHREEPEDFAVALQACGYSTNPKYAQLLMQLVEDFDLAQYDTPAAPATQSTVNSEQLIAKPNPATPAAVPAQGVKQ
jgi:flagellum-specific peptidoglycan hydrolase FlgJ